MKASFLSLMAVCAAFASVPAAATAQSAGPYHISADGQTVLDQTTGLMWTRCVRRQTWDGNQCAGGSGPMLAAVGWDAARRLQAGKHAQAGHEDWRLPTREELNTLVHCTSGKREALDGEGRGGRCEGDYQKPTVDAATFPNTPALPHWSSTRSATEPGGWSVDFTDGMSSDKNPDYFGFGFAVRLVRVADESLWARAQQPAGPPKALSHADVQGRGWTPEGIYRHQGTAVQATLSADKGQGTLSAGNGCVLAGALSAEPQGGGHYLLVVDDRDGMGCPDAVQYRIRVVGGPAIRALGNAETLEITHDAQAGRVTWSGTYQFEAELE